MKVREIKLDPQSDLRMCSLRLALGELWRNYMPTEIYTHEDWHLTVNPYDIGMAFKIVDKNDWHRISIDNTLPSSGWHVSNMEVKVYSNGA